jgi:dTDP-glucose 4,6-dehydratase
MATRVEPRHVPRVAVVTGGAGFIGSNFIRWALERDEQLRVINVDALTYAGNPESLADVAERYGARYRFEHVDITDKAGVQAVFRGASPDTVVHFAAETHVDRSIDGPAVFLQTNIIGTYTMLEVACEAWRERRDVRFHHVSTDEVLGSLGETGLFSEHTPYDPSSPYSASKASADHLVRAWHRTYGLPVTLSNCSNNYGPYQFPEKLIPLVVRKALRGEALPVYGDGRNVRDWLFVEDHCEAIDRVLRCAEVGSVYMVGGREERTNIDVVQRICDLVDELAAPLSRRRRELITFVTDRPGHDRRYAIDPSKLERELGWRARHGFEEGLRRTVGWYLANQPWVERVMSGAYRGDRLGLGER